MAQNVHGSISFNVSEALSGFSICDMQENGDFSIDCKDIEVALLKNPK